MHEQTRTKGAVMTPSAKMRVLIAGGGVAALEAALALRALAPEAVSIDLLAPDLRFWYRPLAVAAPFGAGKVAHLELDSLAEEIGASFVPGGLVGTDDWRHVARTSLNTEIEYDRLLVACGAVPTPAIKGAITFRGPADIEKIERLLEEIDAGAVHSIVFAVPWGAVWSLPAYELALLTASHIAARGLRGVELALVTPELEPLQLFGSEASRAIAALLQARGVEIHVGAYATESVDGSLRLLPEGSIEAERVVALPRLRGAPIDGLPQTLDGFVPVDAHCRVHGVTDVFAAGDITSFTVKQGGIATQQADVAAEKIAAEAGAPVTPSRFTPILRGLLLTGGAPRYLRRELSGRPEQAPVATVDPLWWPPAKIVGRHLAPFLASRAGEQSGPDSPALDSGAVPVEVELDVDEAHALPSVTLRLGGIAEDEEEGRVDAVMTPEPLVVAPEDTLGETAERLLAGDATAAIVCEYGKVIGIVTKSDLLRASAARAHPSESRARQWMTADPVTVTPTSGAATAVTLMREHGIHHLVVIDGERPVGVLRFDDAVREVSIPVGLGF